MTDDITDVTRRLPVYLLLDCSGSMAGDKIEAVEMGLKALLGDLRDNAMALDTVWLSLITFATTAEQIVPLTDIQEFDVVPLSATGATALGEAFELLGKRIDVEVRKNTSDHKGDWKPLVFVLTDGEPTDEWQDTVANFRAQGRATIIACGAGQEVNDSTLRQLGDELVRLKDTQPGTLGALMSWVSSAVTTASQAVGTRRASEQFGPVPESKGITLVR